MTLDKQSNLDLQDIDNISTLDLCLENLGELSSFDISNLPDGFDKPTESRTSFTEELCRSFFRKENAAFDMPIIDSEELQVTENAVRNGTELKTQTVTVSQEEEIQSNLVSGSGLSELTNNIVSSSQARETPVNHISAGNELQESTDHTVTILPSTSRNGELNYVVVVQPTITSTLNSNSVDEIFKPVLSSKNAKHTATSLDASDQGNKKSKKKAESESLISPSQMCNFCDYTNSNKASLNRHIKSHSNERPYKCATCGKGFKSKAYVSNHENIHTGTKPHKCRFCDSAFSTVGELGRHIRYRHTREKPHKCDTCGYTCVELTKLKRHIRGHVGEESLQCKQCVYSTPDMFKFKRHMNSHIPGNSLDCENCGMHFTMPNLLEEHRLTHLKEKKIFSCALCPLTFPHKSHLRKHIQTMHTSVEPIECVKCGMSLPDRYTFKLHNKTHIGEKLKCELCPFKSTYKRQLNLHMLFHTENNVKRKLVPIKKAIPNAVLSYLANQKSHDCPKCIAKFKDFESLKKHFISHIPDAVIRSNQGVKTIDNEKGQSNSQNILDDVNKGEIEVSLEDLDELTLFDDLKLPEDSSLDQVLDMNPKSNMTECIIDQLDEMNEDSAVSADNNNEEYSRIDSVNTENDLISCLGLDELMETEDDISLSSVF